eukprot:TRINITY_DN54_c0_g1_i4.p1 TRINITY_DN54_c0_g1~~TRINITY_DN54_c0_g1_i4.p1  ORF type:complete len:466 (-),score=139.36 TRINITY_DN54_c0_g1_i4:24-1421(-)
MQAGTVEVRMTSGNFKLLANFRPFNRPLSAVAFDPSGSMIISSSIDGDQFKIHKISPNSKNPYDGAQHIYTLDRGISQATVRDLSFSIDSKWVSVSSTRGTTHVFPIHPNGGPVGVGTHLPWVLKAQKEFSHPWVPLDAGKGTKSDATSIQSLLRIKHGSILQETDTPIKFFVTSSFVRNPKEVVGTEKMFVLTQHGQLFLYGLPSNVNLGTGGESTTARVAEVADNKGKTTVAVATSAGVIHEEDPVHLEKKQIKVWNVNRYRDWGEVVHAMPSVWGVQTEGSSGKDKSGKGKSKASLSSPSSGTNQENSSSDDNNDERIREFAETSTYNTRERPIWACQQFSFHTFDNGNSNGSTGSGGNSSSTTTTSSLSFNSVKAMRQDMSIRQAQEYSQQVTFFPSFQVGALYHDEFPTTEVDVEYDDQFWEPDIADSFLDKPIEEVKVVDLGASIAEAMGSSLGALEGL